MRTVKIGTVRLGEGRPRICVPITAASKEELTACAMQAAACPAAEIVEWRADWYRGICGGGCIREALRILRSCLGELPILFTFRSREEGGEASLADEQYENLIREAICAGADAADVELSRGEDSVRRLLDAAHSRNIPVIVSSHDFAETPATEEMTARLLRMHQLGADVCKLAVMPRSPEDVLRLLEATWKLKRDCPDILLITMSMSAAGSISRVCGETFGSVMTFGTAGRASAPGQLDANTLRQIMEALR